MKLRGTLLNNLAAAAQSARRLRGRSVHPDTLEHWKQLLLRARRDLAKNPTGPILPLILELEKEMAEHNT